LYVSDNLKKRMDATGGTINWSEVVRPCIHRAVADFEHRKERTMTTALERLRASKAEYEKELTERATEAAQAWVNDDAEYGDLVRLANIRLESGMDVGAAVAQAVDPNDEFTTAELADHLGIEESDLSDNDFLWDFVAAVQDAYREIADKI
jgi:hypothetical protein